MFKLTATEATTAFDAEKTNANIAFLGGFFKGVIDFFQDLVAYVKVLLKVITEGPKYESADYQAEFDERFGD